MAIETLCPPALIYMIFSFTQIVIDSSKGLYNTALMKFMVMVIFTILLNYLCLRGLSTLSYIIVFVPFILMTLIIAILLYSFGLDPKSGRVNVYHPSQEAHDKKKHQAELQKYNLDERKKQKDIQAIQHNETKIVKEQPQTAHTHKE